MENISKLAMLCDEDGIKLKDDVELMLKMAQVLNELDKEDVIISSEPRLREDTVQQSLTQDQILSNAPNKNEGYIVVPKVMSI